MSNSLLATVGLLCGGLVLLAFVLVRNALEGRRQRWSKRLHPSSAGESGILSRALPEEEPGLFGRLGRSFADMVRQTGLDATPAEAVGWILLAGVLLGGGLWLWRGQLWLTLLGLAVGSGGMFAVFWVMRSRRQRQLQDQLPDAFYLLARSLRAGLSLEQALALLGEQGAKPLAEEFARGAAQIELGLSAPAALQVMARRIRSLDFTTFVTTVSLHQYTGGNLALLLDRLAAGARDRNQFRDYFLSATALGRMTATFLGAAAPLLLLAYAVFQPDFARAFFESTRGWVTVAVVLGLEVVGCVWLYNLLKYES